MVYSDFRMAKKRCWAQYGMETAKTILYFTDDKSFIAKQSSSSATFSRMVDKLHSLGTVTLI